MDSSIQFYMPTCLLLCSQKLYEGFNLCLEGKKDSIPILRSGLLISTKIKRYVQYIGNTRPKSIIKFQQDVSDVEFLLAATSLGTRSRM